MSKPREKTKEPTSVLEWIDNELDRDAELRRQVEERLNQLRIEQDLAKLRERRHVSQRQLAKILGVSQPAIAKLESGKAKNIEIKTLVRYAVALGGRVHIAIREDERARPRSRSAVRGKRGLAVLRRYGRKVAKVS